MVDTDTKMISLRMSAELVDAVKAIAAREDRTFTAQLERYVRDGLTQAQARREHFTVDLSRRMVRHASGVEFQYYEYLKEADWHTTDVAIVANPKGFQGDLNALAAVAKQVAIESGMSYCRPTKRK